jgi:hypothetical protein
MHPGSLLFLRPWPGTHIFSCFILPPRVEKRRSTVTQFISCRILYLDALDGPRVVSSGIREGNRRHFAFHNGSYNSGKRSSVFNFRIHYCSLTSGRSCSIFILAMTMHNDSSASRNPSAKRAKARQSRLPNVYKGEGTCWHSLFANTNTGLDMSDFLACFAWLPSSFSLCRPGLTFPFCYVLALWKEFD